MPFADGVAPFEVVPTITSAESTDIDGSINVAGGSTVVISGNFYGYDDSIVSIVMEDGTECTIISVEPSTLMCTLQELTYKQ